MFISGIDPFNAGQSIVLRKKKKRVGAVSILLLYQGRRSNSRENKDATEESGEGKRQVLMSGTIWMGHTQKKAGFKGGPIDGSRGGYYVRETDAQWSLYHTQYD